MTEITITEKGDLHVMVMHGHAEHPEVCAGISALAYTMAGWLTNNVADSSYQLEPGDSLISYSSDDAQAQAVFDAVTIGLMQIEEGHPDDMHVSRYTY